MMSRKYFVMVLLVLSCSIHVVAQEYFYYHMGNKIPLTLNESKICITIHKDFEKARDRILSNITVLDTIKDEFFELFVVSKNDYEKLISQVSWKQIANSIITSPSYYTENGSEVFSSPYLNLRLKKEEDIDLLISVSRQHGLKIIKQDPFMPLWYILALTQECTYNAVECANKLWESGIFAASVPDLCSDDGTCSDAPNDPNFNLQWGLHNSYHAGKDISVCPAWDYSTGKGIKIAIVDTGIDSTHIDLQSNISNLSYDTETDSSPSQLLGYHGTLCAGIAAAVKDNQKKIAGVAPSSKIISISNSLSETFNSRIKRADGIVWAYEHGADIISNSWSSPTQHSGINEAIHKAIRYGRQGKGCVIVFASGNNVGDGTSVKYPANCNDTILVVGSVDSMGVKAISSNYGPELDIVAPGVHIYSTLPNDSAGYDSGTSFACPHVAGVAALILQRNSELTVSQVDSIICRFAKKLPNVIFDTTKTYGSWNDKYGYGLVDAFNSVLHTPNTVYIQNETITGPRIISGERILVGSDVTDEKESGNVVLRQGNIALQGRYVMIKNSTTVPLGTTLTIGDS